VTSEEKAREAAIDQVMAWIFGELRDETDQPQIIVEGVEFTYMKIAYKPGLTKLTIAAGQPDQKPNNHIGYLLERLLTSVPADSEDSQIEALRGWIRGAFKARSPREFHIDPAPPPPQRPKPALEFDQ